MINKAEIKAMYIMVIVQLIYNWAIPFATKDYHALLASSWFFTFYGYIAFRMIDDALSIKDKKVIKVKWTIGAYFIYRAFIYIIAFFQSFELEDSWKRYKIITSNYYADALIWSIIGLILIYLYKSDIKQKIKGLCRKAKTT